MCLVLLTEALTDATGSVKIMVKLRITPKNISQTHYNMCRVFWISIHSWKSEVDKKERALNR